MSLECTFIIGIKEFSYFFIKTCCGCSKELTHYFEHPKHKLRLIGKQIIANFTLKISSYKCGFSELALSFVLSKKIASSVPILIIIKFTNFNLK